MSEAEAALEVIARRNPQWFADKKTVTTPFGKVKFTSSSEIETSDEETTIKLIDALGFGEKYLRKVDALNREALSDLSDLELAKFGIKRKKKENFSVDTDVVDIGKAVKSAEKSERSAGAAAKKAAALVQHGVNAIAFFLVLFFAAPHAHAQHSADPRVFSALITADTLGPVTAPDLRQIAHTNRLLAELLASFDPLFETDAARYYGRASAFDNVATLLEQRVRPALEDLRAFADSNAALGVMYGFFAPISAVPAANFFGRTEAFDEVADLVERTGPPVLPISECEIDRSCSPLRLIARDAR